MLVFVMLLFLSFLMQVVFLYDSLSSPQKVHLQFELLLYITMFFSVSLFILCQDEALWYCSELYFVQKGSSELGASSALLQRMERQT